MLLFICIFSLAPHFLLFPFQFIQYPQFILPFNFCCFIPPFCGSLWNVDISVLIPWPVTSFCLFLVTLPFFYLTLPALFLPCEASVFPFLTQVFCLSLRSWCPSLTFVCPAFFAVLICSTQMSCFSSLVVIHVWAVAQYYSAVFFLTHCVPKRSDMVVLVSLTIALRVLFLVLYYFILFNNLLPINFCSS